MNAPRRRRLIQGAGVLAVARTVPALAGEADITGRLARHMASAREQPLPPEVLMACKHRILDSLAAMVPGARMRPGATALAYVNGLGGTEQAGVVASDVRTTTVNAKARDLMAPVLGPDKADRLIARVDALEPVADLRELRPLLAA